MFHISGYFTKWEKTLWSLSVICVAVSYFIFDRSSHLTLAASVIGVTSLIFNAKGNPFGQFLIIVFSLMYGYISWGFAYYGEMVTYLGMTAPMALVALIAWLRNPYGGNRAQVKVSSVGRREIVFMWCLTAVVTVVFYFILEYFGTANIVPSTISVTTSFAAVYLTFRRSPYFSIAYAANDVVLIIMWTMAAFEDISYVSVIVCFIAFLVNDINVYVSWKRMERLQSQGI